jgi:hypothetical protein
MNDTDIISLNDVKIYAYNNHHFHSQIIFTVPGLQIFPTVFVIGIYYSVCKVASSEINSYRAIFNHQMCMTGKQG